MEILLHYILNPYRTYNVSKKTTRRIGIFPEKTSADYLEYTVDFSRQLQKEEHIITGKVAVNGTGLSVTSVVADGPYLTAFIEEGNMNTTYYLSYQAQSNLGGSFIQDLVLSVVGGREEAMKKKCSFFSFRPGIKPPDTTPPLDALRINDRYLLTDSGFFMGI